MAGGSRPIAAAAVAVPPVAAAAGVEQPVGVARRRRARLREALSRLVRQARLVRNLLVGLLGALRSRGSRQSAAEKCAQHCAEAFAQTPA